MRVEEVLVGQRYSNGKGMICEVLETQEGADSNAGHVIFRVVKIPKDIPQRELGREGVVATDVFGWWAAGKVDAEGRLVRNHRRRAKAAPQNIFEALTAIPSAPSLPPVVAVAAPVVAPKKSHHKAKPAPVVPLVVPTVTEAPTKEPIAIAPPEHTPVMVKKRSHHKAKDAVVAAKAVAAPQVVEAVKVETAILAVENSERKTAVSVSAKTPRISMRTFYITESGRITKEKPESYVQTLRARNAAHAHEIVTGQR